jgi:site-specific DNA-methyltransferase (adenine-specific)
MILCDLPYGTTGVACANTGREFIGIEKDPTYFVIAEYRITCATI